MVCALRVAAMCFWFLECNKKAKHHEMIAFFALPNFAAYVHHALPQLCFNEVKYAFNREQWERPADAIIHLPRGAGAVAAAPQHNCAIYRLLSAVADVVGNAMEVRHLLRICPRDAHLNRKH